MSTLIPDGRLGLLGGLVDDATLLGPGDPSIEEAVDAYRRRRAKSAGWMVGRFVAPTSRLDELASTLVQTMTSGEAPWSIVAVLDGPSPSLPANAASFHALMNPAASVDVIHITAPDTATGEAEASAAAIHHRVLPMLPDAAINAVGLRRPRVGLVLDVDIMEAPAVASRLQMCAASGVPFTLNAATIPGSTVGDPAAGSLRFGVVNLLAASVMAQSANDTEIEAALLDTDPAGYAIGFGGLTRHGYPVRSGRSLGAGRAPLVSVAASEPDDALAVLGRLETAG